MTKQGPTLDNAIQIALQATLLERFADIWWLVGIVETGVAIFALPSTSQDPSTKLLVLFFKYPMSMLSGSGSPHLQSGQLALRKCAEKRGMRAMVLGAGLEPACLSAYAPQTYVSAISPPERPVESR